MIFPVFGLDLDQPSLVAIEAQADFAIDSEAAVISRGIRVHPPVVGPHAEFFSAIVALSGHVYFFPIFDLNLCYGPEESITMEMDAPVINESITITFCEQTYFTKHII